MYYKILIIIIMVLLLSDINEPLIAKDLSESNVKDSTINDIFKIARYSTGFDISGEVITKKNIIMLSLSNMNDSTILITNKKYELPLWEITLKHPQINLSNWEMDNRFIKDYTIYVEEKNQQVVEIWGVCQDYFDSLNVSITYRSLIKNISDNNMLIVDSIEGYCGVPEEKPKINFIQALNEHLFGSPYLAKLIICKYVLFSCHNSEIKPAWALHLYGLPKMFSNEGEGYTEWRTVIDAQNGNMLWSSSGPCINIK